MSRQRLLKRLTHIRALPGPTTTARMMDAELLPVAAVAVDASLCSGCELCARYCPTGALTFTTTDSEVVAGSKSFAVSLRLGLCIDCGICEVACPEEAVSFAANLDGALVLDPMAVTLVEGELVACSACSLPTAARPGDTRPLCFSCRLGSGVVTALRDDAGLMADLLSRIPPSDLPT